MPVPVEMQLWLGREWGVAYTMLRRRWKGQVNRLDKGGGLGIVTLEQNNSDEPLFLTDAVCLHCRAEQYPAKITRKDDQLPSSLSGCCSTCLSYPSLSSKYMYFPTDQLKGFHCWAFFCLIPFLVPPPSLQSLAKYLHQRNFGQRAT